MQNTQSQIQDFPTCGVPSRRDSVEGGVVAEFLFFCGLRKPARLFSWGGGSSRIFPWSTKAYAVQWGGVVAQNLSFSWPPKAGAIQWGRG